MTPAKGSLIGFLGLLFILGSHAQLDASEINALAAVFDEYSATLSNADYVFPAWTPNAACACGCMSGLPFGGVGCVNGHVESLYAQILLRQGVALFSAS